MMSAGATTGTTIPTADPDIQIVPEPASPQTVPVRNWRERALQTVAYELGGLLLIAPLWSAVSGESGGESLLLLAALSVAVMTWMSIYNTVCDLLEARLAHRVASERPQRWRVIHAVGMEITSVLATTPVVVLVTGYGWLEAMLVDIGLGIVYAGYGYLFHLVFDRLRPVKATSMNPSHTPG